MQNNVTPRNVFNVETGAFGGKAPSIILDNTCHRNNQSYFIIKHYKIGILFFNEFQLMQK